MTSIYLNTFLSVTVVSAISLLGVATLILKPKFLHQIVKYLVACSAGVMLGDVFLHLLPELSEQGFDSFLGLVVIAGILIFILIEKAIHWHHSHNDDEHKAAALGYLVIWGDAVHNLIDGILIAASFLVSPQLGIATSIAVIFHEIPHEIGDFGVLLHSGFSTKKALLYNFLSALTAFIGAGIVLTFTRNLTAPPKALIAFAASSFLYISLSDLIPELHSEKHNNHFIGLIISLIVGVLLMGLLIFVE